MKIDASRAVGAYAVFATALLGWVVLAGAVPGAKSLGTIDVERINVREPDGTLRMVIAGKARIGGLVIGGKEYPHPNRKEAGMIFYNDQGDENGGLVFSGGLIAGKPQNAGSLTFDRWRQDQTIQMTTSEDGDGKSAGFVVMDRPAHPMDIDRSRAAMAMPSGPAKDAAYAELSKGIATRVYLGSRDDRSAELALRDPQGHVRLRLAVDATGQPSVRFLDAAGKETRRIEASASPTG